MTDTPIKPGCYGSVIMYEPTTNRCTLCPLSAACEVFVAENRVKLDALLAAGAGAAPTSKRRATKPKAAPTPELLDLDMPEPEPIAAQVFAVAKPVVEPESVSTPEPKPTPEPTDPTISSAATKPVGVVIDGIYVDFAGVNKKARDLLDRWSRAKLPVSKCLDGVNGFADCNNKFVTEIVDLLLERKSVQRAGVIVHLLSRHPWTQATATSHARMGVDALQALGLVTVTPGEEIILRTRE